MKISLYTFVRNGLAQDYHLLDMLKHHIPFADEIIVHEGYSSDGTYEAIKDLHPMINIFRSDWDANTGMNFAVKFKDDARKRCTGDWCILMDCDEFIPEWEFESIRKTLANTNELMLPAKILNFYGNYQVVNNNPDAFRWPGIKMLAHRNTNDIEVWGDGSSVRQKGVEFSIDPGKSLFTCHHFGFVRHPGRLREKWRNMRGRLYNAKKPLVRLPSFLFSLFPHNWKDPDYLPHLELYEGPHIKAVRENPKEFIRDNLQLYHHFKKQDANKVPA